MTQLLDTYLDRITMYKVLMWGLVLISFYGIVCGFIGYLPFTGIHMLISLGILLGICWTLNFIVAKILKIPVNTESAIITALILFLILLPFENISSLWTFILAASISMLSKYIFAFQRKHIFNPAAIACVILGLFGNENVFWWVGSLVMLPVVSVVGFLILKKVRRFSLFFTFLFTTSLATAGIAMWKGYVIADVLSQSLVSGPVIFFATVMLTEPMTIPYMKRLRLYYAVLVGLLYSAQFHIGPVYTTPELALVIGNIYSFIINPKKRLQLFLADKKHIASDMYEFIFAPKANFSYFPGQYMEWTIDAKHADSRGNRRYFTISSSPTEGDIRLGIKFPTPSSSFKKHLLDISATTPVYAGQLGGDFIMPADTKKKLVFLAGGIGVTPFRSMMKYLIDTKQTRDIVLFYTNKTAGEVVYKEIFDQAKDFGLKVIYTITDKEHVTSDWKGRVGRVDESMIKKEVPDFTNRLFYISGPQPMVVAYKKLLKDLGIPTKHIMVDYFPGFA